MRRLSYLFLLVLLVACGREEALSQQEWDGPVIELTLHLEESDGMRTKAEGDPYSAPGENAYRENQIDTVDFYFYPGGATSEPASYHIRQIMIPSRRDGYTFRMELTTNQVNHLIFPTYPNDVTETLVYAIVNSPKGLLDSVDDTSMETINRLVFTTDFEKPESHRQQRFVMSGTTTLTLNGRTKKVVAQGTVDLYRYACKLTVGVKPEEVVAIQTTRTDKTGYPIFENWTPCVEEMQIYIEDAVKNVSLGGNAAATEGGASSPVTLSYRKNPLLFFENVGSEASPVYEQIYDQTDGYYNTDPMYMYPQYWVDGISEGDTKEPYLKLVLPWERTEYRDADTGETYVSYAKKPFYYKILIPKDRRGGDFINHFVRNNWYHYYINVGMLGADTDDAAVEINPIDFYVYYWQDKDMVIRHADIGNARYLSVDEEEYFLYNETELDIRFTSSHSVDYQINSATRPYYGTGDPDLIPTGGTLEEDGKTLSYNADSWFEKDGGTIRFTHSLNNNYTSKDFDYSPYTISLTIWHEDKAIDSDYSKTVIIHQYPAIYITEEENSDPRVNDPSRGLPIAGDETENANAAVWQNFAHNGYVFEDGRRRWRHVTARNDDGEYGTAAKKLGDWNKNIKLADVQKDPYYYQRLQWLQWRTINFTGGSRSRYTVFVSVLPESGQYIVGDPRTESPEVWRGGPDDAPGYEDSYDGHEYFYYKEGEDPNEHFSIQFEEGPDIRTYKQDLENKRELTNYYPCENSDRTKNMLAPALRVSSRFGGTEFYGLPRRSAEFKCATYQEDGYPAGRWRLPTKAEIDFIATLTLKGGFVKLFSNNQNYWSANGVVLPTQGLKPNVHEALVRCVYDAWYWDVYPGSLSRLPEEDRDTYVLGDIARYNP